jgi:hypothetical protein
MKKLYRVTVEADMLCYAKNEAEACDIAADNVCNIDFFYEGTSSASLVRASDLDFDELGSLPYTANDGDEDLTCKQILFPETTEEDEDAKRQEAMAKNTLALPGIE